MRERRFTPAGEMKNVAHTLPLMELLPSSPQLCLLHEYIQAHVRMTRSSHSGAKWDLHSNACHSVHSTVGVFLLTLNPPNPVPSRFSWCTPNSCHLSCLFTSFPSWAVDSALHGLASIKAGRSCNYSQVHHLLFFSSLPFFSPCTFCSMSIYLSKNRTKLNLISCS